MQPDRVHPDHERREYEKHLSTLVAATRYPWRPHPFIRELFVFPFDALILPLNRWPSRWCVTRRRRITREDRRCMARVVCPRLLSYFVQLFKNVSSLYKPNGPCKAPSGLCTVAERSMCFTVQATLYSSTSLRTALYFPQYFPLLLSGLDAIRDSLRSVYQL